MAEKFASLEDLKEVKDKLGQLAEDNARLKEENKNLHAAFNKLGAGVNEIKTEPVAKPVLPTKTVKVTGTDGKDGEYKWRLAQFMYKRRGTVDSLLITAADAATDEDLVRELVEIGSGALVRVG